MVSIVRIRTRFVIAQISCNRIRNIYLYRANLKTECNICLLIYVCPSFVTLRCQIHHFPNTSFCALFLWIAWMCFVCVSICSCIYAYLHVCVHNAFICCLSSCEILSRCFVKTVRPLSSIIQLLCKFTFNILFLANQVMCLTRLYKQTC